VKEFESNHVITIRILRIYQMHIYVFNSITIMTIKMFSIKNLSKSEVKTKTYEWLSGIVGIPQKREQQSNASAEKPSNDTILKTTNYDEMIKDNILLAINLNFKQILNHASSWNVCMHWKEQPG
jgi:hypothetical protein